jgi:hypothetical protein
MVARATCMHHLFAGIVERFSLANNPIWNKDFQLTTLKKDQVYL